MADMNIGSLPAATEIQDDTLMVGEQQGEAVQLPASLWKAYALAVFNSRYDSIVSDVLAKIPTAESEYV